MRRFNWLTKKYVIFPLLLLALLAGAFPLFTQFHKAHADGPRCYGESCYNQNPVTNGCYVSSYVSKPLMYHGQQLGYVINYYSYRCNANWVQFTPTTTLPSNFRIGLYIDDGYDGYNEQVSFPDNGCYAGASGWPAWTFMINGTGKTYGDVWLCDSNGNMVSDITQVIQ